jgi:hypothetical protein
MVAPDGTLTVHVPADGPPGDHRVVLVIEEPLERDAVARQRPSLDVPVRDYGPWPEGLSLWRENMYGDDEWAYMGVQHD